MMPSSADWPVPWRSLSARPVLHPVLEHERGRNVVLRRERIRRAQRRLGPARDQGEDEVRGLGGDMEARGDRLPIERPLGLEALAYLREHRHLLAGPRDA